MDKRKVPDKFRKYSALKAKNFQNFVDSSRKVIKINNVCGTLYPL